MKNNIKLWWRSIDQQIFLGVLVLFFFSIMLVTSAGSIIAHKIGLNENYFALRQIIYLLLASCIITVLSFLNPTWLKRISILGFIICITTLWLLPFYGYEIKGAVRWMTICGLSIQPSEFIKPFFIVLVGWLLSIKFNRDFPGFSICITIYLILAFSLIIQPDFGMLLMITIILGIQFFLTGIHMLWILISILILTSTITIGYFYFPHVSKRINNFLDPANIENYQVIKSIKAFEHGGIYGVGPGEGVIKHVLPDAHTDFIFAVAGEEFGAIICLIIIGTFAFIVIRSLLNLINKDDKFIQISSVGIITQFALQSIINMSVTLNLLPTKGMTLPFISYGGCSIIATSISIGMLLGFTRYKTSFSKYKVRNIDI